MIRRAPVAGALLALTATLGCEPGSQTASSDAIIGAAACLTEPQPRLVIAGGLDAGDEPWFGSVNGAALLSDGGVVVADRQRARLHFFTAGGGYLTGVGRTGEGPGEFRFLVGVDVRGDTVIAEDATLRRLTHYSSAGELLFDRPYPGRSVMEPLPVIGPFDDGSYVTVENVTRLSRGPEPQLFQDTSEFRHVSAEGEVLSVLGRFPQASRYSDLSRGVFDIGVTAYGQAPTYVGLGDRLLVAQADAPLLRLVRLDGSTERVIEVPNMSRAVDAELMRLHRAHHPGGELNPGDRFGFPERTPPYGPVRVDRSGRIWVAAPHVPPQHQVRYFVLDGEGTTLEDLEISHDGSITWLDARDDALVLRVTDELGIDRVVVHERGCGGGA